MVVAFAAHVGLREPCGADAFHAVGHGFRLVFLGLRAAFLGGEDEAVVGAGDACFVGNIGQQIAGDLFDGESVEAFIRVEGADDVVAIWRDVSGVVGVIAGGVGVADEIEPPHSHALAVMRGCEEFLDELFVGVGSLVVHEGVEFLGLWRESGDVEINTAAERGAVSLRGVLDAEHCVAREDKSINRVAREGEFARCGRCRFFRRDVCPVLLILRALLDPFPQDFFVALAELAVLLFRRHHVVFVLSSNALPHFALIRFSGQYRKRPIQFRHCRFAHIEPQVGLAGFRVEAVASKTIVRKNRADIAVVFHFRR